MFGHDKPIVPFVARGYGRASTEKQVISTEQQEAVCFDVFQIKKRVNPVWSLAEWGGFIADEATCRDTKFRQRHGGSLILAGTKPNDRIMCSSQDRLCCGAVDTSETFDLAAEMRFHIVIGDQDIDPNDENIRLTRMILAQVAEYELRKIRSRTREALDYRKRVGKPAGACPVGWKIVHCRLPSIPQIQKYFVPHTKARRLAEEIRAIKEANNLTYTGAAEFCNKIGRKRLDRRRWNHPTFIKWCRAAEQGFPLPNGSHTAAPIPPDAVPIKVTTITEDD